ncbi:hypothetical protein IF1G_07462 [Cordyceps javanica]|uniref:Uncharacterized protein n=1 Tax=Cordyceps javanica TaxID=43265 RepID=A0A545UW83_9HYPO|nr:hypothetical protein IF1G_07462 [Cordyceps javanica]
MSLKQETPNARIEVALAKMEVAFADLKEAMNSADSSLTDHSSYEAVRTAVQKISGVESYRQGRLKPYLERLDRFNEHFDSVFPDISIAEGIWMPIIPLSNTETLWFLLESALAFWNGILWGDETLRLVPTPDVIAMIYIKIIRSYTCLFNNVTKFYSVDEQLRGILFSLRFSLYKRPRSLRRYFDANGMRRVAEAKFKSINNILTTELRNFNSEGCNADQREREPSFIIETYTERPCELKRRAREISETVTTDSRNFNPEGCNADQRERGPSVINKTVMAEQHESLNGSSEGQMETGLGESMEVSSAKLRNLNFGGGSADQRESEGITGSRAPAEATSDGKLDCDDDAGAEKEAI